jgi:hypothetical protein
MDANIDNKENDDQQQADEREKEQKTAAAAKRRCLKAISVLKRREKFPCETRYEMDEVIEEFLDKVEDTIHRLFWDKKNPEICAYDGLDSNDDYHTEEEVETAVRFFPDVLSRKEIVHSNEYDDEYNYRTFWNHPIQIIAFILREDGTWG